MISQVADVTRVVAVRLDPGEDLLEGIRVAADQHGIRNGVILAGLGSLSAYRFHVVETTGLPPGDVFRSGEGPFDITTITGLVLSGRVHAHLTFSNTERALGGHLEPGCTVLTFAMVVLGDAPDLDLSGWDAVGPSG